MPITGVTAPPTPTTAEPIGGAPATIPPTTTAVPAVALPDRSLLASPDDDAVGAGSILFDERVPITREYSEDSGTYESLQQYLLSCSVLGVATIDSVAPNAYRSDIEDDAVGYDRLEMDVGRTFRSPPGWDGHLALMIPTSYDNGRDPPQRLLTEVTWQAVHGMGERRGRQSYLICASRFRDTGWWSPSGPDGLTEVDGDRLRLTSMNTAYVGATTVDDIVDDIVDVGVGVGVGAAETSAVIAAVNHAGEVRVRLDGSTTATFEVVIRGWVLS